MKRAVANLIILIIISCVMPKCYAWDDSNRVDATQSTFMGALIVVKPMRDNYHLGAPMLVSISITNISKEEIRLVDTNPEEDDYHVSLYSSGGTLVRSSTTESQADRSTLGNAKSRSILTIGPGQSVSKSPDLRKSVHIETEGIYYLIVTRRILTWDSGFVVSDKVKIEVVK
jgi:hypothetical protein